MKIETIINKISDFYKDGDFLKKNSSRDKVLYGNVEKECTGIVTTQWASIDVIKQAIEKKANLIICHEALFWNHGDHTEWLEHNNVYQTKRDLLEYNGITVWRNHDHIHSGMKIKDEQYVDGIFYALAKSLGWEQCSIDNDGAFRRFIIPTKKLKDIVSEMLKVLNLNGAKIIGNMDAEIIKIAIPSHILGDANDFINEIDSNDIDLIIAMELVDFTVTEYIVDSLQLGNNINLITVGHFNTEEIGMKYFSDYLFSLLDGTIDCEYIQSGDIYNYIEKI